MKNIGGWDGVVIFGERKIVGWDGVVIFGERKIRGMGWNSNI